MKKTKRQIAFVAIVLFLCVSYKYVYASGGESSPPPPPPNAEVIKKSAIPLKTDGKLVVSEDMVKCTQWEYFNEVKDTKLHQPRGYIEESIEPYIEADECIEEVLETNDAVYLHNNSTRYVEDNGKDIQFDSSGKEVKAPKVFCSKKYSKIHYGQPYEFVCGGGELPNTCSDDDVEEYGCQKGEDFCKPICVSQICHNVCSGSGHSGGSGSESCKNICKCNQYDTNVYTKSVKFNSKRCVKWELAYPIGQANIDPNKIEFYE